MSHHPDNVEGYEGTLEELAFAVENMKYNFTSEFLSNLSIAFEKRADSDFIAGRYQLASRLYCIALNLYVVAENTALAWKLCEPYMASK